MTQPCPRTLAYDLKLRKIMPLKQFLLLLGKYLRCSIWNCYFQRSSCLASITGCAGYILLLLLFLPLILLLFLLLSLLLLWMYWLSLVISTNNLISNMHWRVFSLILLRCPTTNFVLLLGDQGRWEPSGWVEFLSLNHVK